MKRSLGVICGLSCLSVGLLVGCSSAAPVPAPTTIGADLGPASGTVNIPASFAALRDQAVRDQESIHNAIEREIVGCMKEKGFKYTPAPTPSGENPGSQGLVVGDVEQAKKVGFNGVDSLTKKDDSEDTKKLLIEKNDDIKGMSQEQQDAFDEALFGPALSPEVAPTESNDIAVVVDGRVASRKGCLNESRAKLYGGDLARAMKASLNFIYDMASQVGQRIEKDESFKAVNERRTKCIKDAGFADEPAGGYGEYYARKAKSISGDQAKLAELREEEVKTATAAAQCSQQVNVGGVIKILQDKYEKEVLDENQGVVLAWSESNSAAAERAKEILK